MSRLYNVRSLFVFDSAAADHLRSDSDIDMVVVDIDSKDPLAYPGNYFNLKFQLEQLLNRPIDLPEQKAIGSPFQINKSLERLGA